MTNILRAMFFLKDDHSVASALGEGVSQNLLSGKGVQDREQSAWKSFGRERSSAGASWQRTSGILFLWKGEIINLRYYINLFTIILINDKQFDVSRIKLNVYKRHFDAKYLLFRKSSQKKYLHAVVFKDHEEQF